MRGPVRAIALGAVVFGSTSWQGTESIRAVDAPDVLRLVAENRGKVVLLHFWASWCPPCHAEFPEIVAVARQYRDRGLAVVSVSSDFSDRIDSDLRPFLERYRPPFPVYLKKTDDPERFARAIDPDWTGSLPATFFFDRQGNGSVKRYSKMTRPEIERILEFLLDEPRR